MGVEVYVKPVDVWKFFNQYCERLAEERIVVAENTETKYEICVTERVGFPQLIVLRQDIQQYEETVISEKDCADTAKLLYMKYLFPVTVSSSNNGTSNKKIPVEQPKVPEEKPDPHDEDDDFDLTPEEMKQMYDDMIVERDDELILAARDFLVTLFGFSEEYFDEVYGEIIEDFLDQCCEQVARDYELSVYRPRWEIDPETGEKHFEEYPYLDVSDIE